MKNRADHVQEHGHNGTGAIGHQDIICNPDWDFFSIYWIDSKAAGENAGLYLYARDASRSISVWRDGLLYVSIPNFFLLIFCM